MDFVEPIRDVKKITQIKNMLRWSEKIRDLLLFELGINSALRISDLLSLQVHHLYHENETIKKSFEVKEQKTNKKNTITITPKVVNTLTLYKKIYPKITENLENYVFFAQKSFPLWSKHIGRKQAWKLITKRCKNVWLSGRYWWHTLRKTWWYHARMKGITLPIIQHKLNHSNIGMTLKYLWITAEEIEEACNTLDL